MKIISVVGARPNFMKIAPFVDAIEAYNQDHISQQIEHILVHTGQHYDDRMSKVFFESLGIPEADIHLNVGSGSHAQQVGNTMMAFEKVIHEEQPDWVVVVGDVNATLACSVTAKKEGVKLCHIEAGLRSGDMDMPEEINRLVTDRLSDLLLTPDRIASDNLRCEGVPEEKIAFVGNIMIDTLEKHRKKAALIKIEDILQKNLLEEEKSVPEVTLGYVAVTMHRPSNVDVYESLKGLIGVLTEKVAKERVVIWPIHPRTKGKLEAFGLWQRVSEDPNIILLHPLGYHEMLRINMGADAILTDSGGLQEESCVLGTPCMTLRWNTERPVTLQEHGGASILVGNDVGKLYEAWDTIKRSERTPSRPELWDGKTAQRCLSAILEY